MKWIKNIGLLLLLIGLVFFTSLIFTGSYEITPEALDGYLDAKGVKSEVLRDNLSTALNSQEEKSQYAISSIITESIEKANAHHQDNQEWDKVIYDSPHSFGFDLIKNASQSPAAQRTGLWFFLTFGIGIIGALMYIIPDVVLLGPPGIKHHGIYHNSITNRGWIALVAFIYLVGFYILLYWFADYVVNWVHLVDPISTWLSGNPASQWFLYGFLYCTVMTVMAVRMIIKYRHNAYQIIRTCVVLFFQVAFAFLIPEILVRFNLPYMDFKNAWPLDYDFFFDWNINSLMASGKIGLFMLFWGVILTLIIVPVMVYFFGKRWYCSWVCGCGGLAETLGDPFRQHSDKGLRAWKIERWLIHTVLIFAVIMTAGALYTFFTEEQTLLGMNTGKLRSSYGFLIGSVFSGVIGTGFYPVMGNRVWCRFGCPLAAYMGLVQRFKSRFRITTNGGQCISCGNCSTYCEQGIDVRWYAQRGENIVRSSCVGCGVCSAVCPRGVLKLENGPEAGRISDNPIMIGSDGVTLNMDL